MSRGFIDIANNFKTEAWELVQRTEAGSIQRHKGVVGLMEIADSQLPSARLQLSSPHYGGRIAERVIGTARALLAETVRTKRRGGDRWLSLEGKLNDSINDAIGDRGLNCIEPAKAKPEKAPKSATMADEPDTKGEVINPSDQSAYVAARIIVAEHPPAGRLLTHKQLAESILPYHPEIKRWHPKANRLMVHLADWLKYVKSLSQSATTDDWATPDEVEKNKSTAKRFKQRGE